MNNGDREKVVGCYWVCYAVRAPDATSMRSWSAAARTRRSSSSRPRASSCGGAAWAMGNARHAQMGAHGVGEKQASGRKTRQQQPARRGIARRAHDCYEADLQGLHVRGQACAFFGAPFLQHRPALLLHLPAKTKSTTTGEDREG